MNSTDHKITIDQSRQPVISRECMLYHLPGDSGWVSINCFLLFVDIETTNYHRDLKKLRLYYQRVAYEVRAS